MSEINIPEMIELTGLGRETISARLKGLDFKMGRRNAKMFDSREALPALYGTDGATNLSQAKTVLAQKQAEKLDLDMDIKRGGVIHYQPMLEMMQRTFVAFRTKMLSIPTKAAPKVVDETDPVNVQILLEELVWEALEEISDLVEYVKQLDSTHDGGGEKSEAA